MMWKTPAKFTWGPTVLPTSMVRSLPRGWRVRLPPAATRLVLYPAAYPLTHPQNDPDVYAHHCVDPNDLVQWRWRSTNGYLPNDVLADQTIVTLGGLSVPNHERVVRVVYDDDDGEISAGPTLGLWCCWWLSASSVWRLSLFSSLVREVAAPSGLRSLAASCLRLSRKVSFLSHFLEEVRRQIRRRHATSSPLPSAPRLAWLISWWRSWQPRKWKTLFAFSQPPHCLREAYGRCVTVATNGRQQQSWRWPESDSILSDARTLKTAVIRICERCMITCCIRSK